MADNFSDANSTCNYYPMEFLWEKFIIVGVFGAGVSVAGMILNILAFVVLGRLLSKSPSLIYLWILSILDLLFMCEYLMLLSTQIYFDYFDSVQLYFWWNGSVRYNHTLAKIVQTSSTYLIIAASVERFGDVGNHFRLKHTDRMFISSAVISLSISLRLISYWELEVVVHPECEGFARLSISLSPLTRTTGFHIYNFYVMHIVGVFLPFILLLILNVGIVYTIRQSLKRKDSQVLPHNSAWKPTERHKNLSNATRMLISVVSTYLASNTLSFSITLMEHTDMQLLMSNLPVYTFSVDFINLLYVTSAASRLVIYIFCSDKIRSELMRLLSCLACQPQMWLKKKPPNRPNTSNSVASGKRVLSPLSPLLDNSAYSSPVELRLLMRRW